METPHINTKWFSNKFIEDILKKAENNSGIIVTNSNTKEATEKGDNYGSLMIRVTADVVTNGNQENKCLIYKLIPEGEQIRELIINSTAFQRENRMLRDVIPKMEALLEKNAPKKRTKFCPKCYYSEMEIPYVLIMEDLNARGFKLEDKTKGADLEHSLLVMRTLARFHASSYAIFHEQPDDFELFSENFLTQDPETSNFMETFSKTQVKSLIEVARKWEDDDGKEIARRLEMIVENIFSEMKNAFQCNSEDFNVLSHGDLWLNNMMFRCGDSGTVVEEVVFVDFQLSTIESFALDLYKFMYTSISDTVRRHHMQDLLRTYHTELSETLAVLGREHNITSYQTFTEQFERKIFAGFYWTATTLEMTLRKRGEAFDFEKMGEETPRLSSETEEILKRLLTYFRQKNVF